MYVANSVSYELLVFIAAALAVSPFIAMHVLATKTRHNDWLLTALVALAFALAWRSYAIRPELINPVFFVALVWLIDDFRREESNRIWLAVPLTFAWANLQAGFPVALGVLAAWCAVCLLERRTPWRSLAVLVAAAIVPLLNAYGPALYGYAFASSLSHNVDRTLVVEWQSPDFHDPLNYPTLVGMIVLAYFGLRSQDKFRQVLALGTLAANLISARFVPFFALSLIYAVAPQLPFIQMPRWGLRALVATGPALLILSVAAVVGSFAQHPPLDAQPVGGLAYLRAHAPGARVYADQSWGSYLTWSGWPTFFDTRTHQVFPEKLIADYHKVERTKGDWLSVLNSYDIEYVMMQPDSDLAEALDAMGWQRMYEGTIEVIWKRPAVR
jgi:hypothetical protein